MATLFGKLPAHGDFVARGLSAADRDALDAWLSASMIDARERFGDTFEARFDAAQPWRCTGAGVAGALAASQDAAGRRFPVVLLCAGEDADACEALLYDAIAQGWDADRLASAAPPPSGAPEGWSGPDGATRAGATPPDLIAAMLA